MRATRKQTTILSLWVGLLLSLLLVFQVSLPAQAQDDPPATPLATPSDDEVNAIAHNMYCPVCENIPLDTCGTAACKQWRAEIRDKLSSGWTPDQIYAYFELKYGDRVLAVPPREGFNWLLYVIPPLIILVAIYFLVSAMRSRVKPEAASIGSKNEPAPSGVDDQTLARLEAELKKRDE
jgi:cytochrome c-type biogenesis protein CcmH